MAQSRTLFLGMDVHKETIAVAYVAQEPGAEGPPLGTMGTRQGDSDQRVRTMPSQATPLICVYAAGPGGSWLSRSLTTKGDDGWGGAPSLRPTKAGDRVHPDRRDARHLARLARAGARTVVYVAHVADAALRELTRARAEARSDGQDAKVRLKAFLLRPDIRSPGRATWGPAPLRGLSAGLWPTPAQHSVCQEDVRAVTAHTARLQRLAQARHAHVPAWRWPPGGRSPAGAPGRAMPCGRHPGRGQGRAAPFCYPTRTHAIPGAAPVGIGCRGATPTGREPPRWHHPGPTGARGRRLGLPLSRQGQPTSATAPRNTTPTAPGPQLASPSPAVHTRPPTRGARPAGAHRHRRPCPCARGLSGGSGSTAAGRSVSRKGRSPLPPQRRRGPTCISKGAAPLWCTPRQRYEACTGYACLARGRHPTEARKVGTNPPRAAGSTVVSSWLRLCRCTQAQETAG